MLLWFVFVFSSSPYFIQICALEFSNSCVLFSFRAMHTSLCIPPDQQQQLQLSSLDFFDRKWQNSTFCIYARSHTEIMRFVIIRTKKGKTKPNQTKCNIHSEFEKIWPEENKNWACALFSLFLENFPSRNACVCVCARMIYIYTCIHNNKLFELAVLCAYARILG